MPNEIEKLKAELQKTVNERNAAWFQLEEANIQINPTKNKTEDAVLSGYPESIGELQELIKDIDPEKKLAGTWEATWRSVSLYTAKDDTVVIDLDDNTYKDAIVSGNMLVDHNAI